MKKLATILSFTLILFASCVNNNKDKTANYLSDTVSFNYDSIHIFSKKIIKSDNNTSDTTKALIYFPQFKDTIINQFVLKQINDFYSEQEKTYSSYNDMAQSFLSGYEDYLKDDKLYKNTWFLNIRIEVLKQRSNYLSLLYTHADYTGGAHPNTVFSYINYNPKLHTIITLDSLFIKDYKQKLITVAERIFRKHEDLSANESLSGKYFFEGDKFALPENFTINEDGLNFLYNPYEIKSYAEGTTKLVIPFTELKDIIKPNSILTTFSK